MKNWYESKTIWLNVIALLVLVIPVVLDAMMQTFPDLGLLPIWGGAVLAILNIVLRFLTDVPLARKV